MYVTIFGLDIAWPLAMVFSMHPLIHRPEYDATELEEITSRLSQSVKLPVSQVCPSCVAAALEQILEMPICFKGGVMIDAMEVRDAIEEGFFDDMPRIDDPYHNAEAYINYLMDLVNIGVDDIWLYADACYEGCPICGITEKSLLGIQSLCQSEGPPDEALPDDHV